MIRNLSRRARPPILVTSAWTPQIRGRRCGGVLPHPARAPTHERCISLTTRDLALRHRSRICGAAHLRQRRALLQAPRAGARACSLGRDDLVGLQARPLYEAAEHPLLAQAIGVQREARCGRGRAGSRSSAGAHISSPDAAVEAETSSPDRARFLREGRQKSFLGSPARGDAPLRRHAEPTQVGSFAGPSTSWFRES